MPSRRKISGSWILSWSTRLMLLKGFTFSTIPLWAWFCHISSPCPTKDLLQIVRVRPNTPISFFLPPPAAQLLMGVKYLLPLLCYAHKKVHVGKTFEGQFIIVDGFVWLHEAVAHHAREVVVKKNFSPVVNELVWRCYEQVPGRGD